MHVIMHIYKLTQFLLICSMCRILGPIPATITSGWTLILEINVWMIHWRMNTHCLAFFIHSRWMDMNPQSWFAQVSWPSICEKITQKVNFENTSIESYHIDEALLSYIIQEVTTGYILSIGYDVRFLSVHLEFKLCYLKNLKLLSMRVKEF